MRKFSVGEPIGGWPVETWNSLVDAKFVIDRMAAFVCDSFPQYQALQHACVVHIVNKSGYDVHEFDILGIDNSALTPPTIGVDDSADEVILGGVQLECVELDDTEHADRFVVALEPIADGESGRAVIAGVTWARVAIQTSDDLFADLDDSDSTKFVGSISDGEQILWKPSGTGDKWCIVLLGAPRHDAQLKWGKLEDDLDYDDTTGVTVSVWTGHPLVDSGKDIENVLPPPTMESGTISANDFVRIVYFNGHWYVDMAPC